MSETKGKAKLFRKSLLHWRRPEIIDHPADQPPSRVDNRKAPRPWYRPTFLKVSACLLVGLLFLPSAARGQFGIDTAAILAALSKINGLMQQFIATPLKDINQAEQTTSKFEQEVMYPIAAINQAKAAVTQFESQFRQMSNLFRTTNVSSATLPQSQNLESLLLSGNAANVTSISPQFQNVYGVIMAQNSAPSTVRNMTDMTDAQAQDAMKRAVQIDALANQELTVADQMGSQITTASPGSAPILEAEADVWVVRANAYTQAAFAELMRIRGIDIANQSNISKLATSDNTGNNSLITGALTNK